MQRKIKRKTLLHLLKQHPKVWMFREYGKISPQLPPHQALGPNLIPLRSKKQ